MKHLGTLALLFGLVLFLAPAKVGAQTPLVTDDEVKVNIYKKFVENWERNPPIAYEAAKEYMRRYGKEDDQYTKYFRLWLPAYEKEDRESKLLQAIYGDKNYAAGYALAKQVLADDPENVKVLIALGYGGYLATTNTKNESFNADSIRYAQKAIQLIEAGRAPDEWKPFQNKDDALSSLYYALGFTQVKTQPDQAIGQFIKVSQIDGVLRKTPSTYYFLAVAYEQGPFKRLSADYTKRFANQPETPESKAALDTLNKVMDRIIDAYARAIALAGTDAQHQANKAEWMKRLTDLYKFRHENSDAGLNELIASVLSKPLLPPQ
jgi:hypothetical protein